MMGDAVGVGSVRGFMREQSVMHFAGERSQAERLLQEGCAL